MTENGIGIRTAGSTAVTGATGMAGALGDFFGWMHTNIGFIATCIGIIGTIFIIVAQYYNIRKMRIETSIALKHEKERECHAEENSQNS